MKFIHVCLLSLPNTARVLHNTLVAYARPQAVITHFCSGELLINFVTTLAIKSAFFLGSYRKP